MSNLLKMASDLNQVFAERASATEKMLNDEFSRLETSVNEAVTSEESKIKDAIRDHTDSVTALLAEHRQSIASAMKTEWPALLRLAGKTFFMTMMFVLLFCLAGWGVLAYQGGKMRQNLNTLDGQEARLAQLNGEIATREHELKSAKAWGLEYREVKGARYLVLPDNLNGALTRLEGKQAVKLKE